MRGCNETGTDGPASFLTDDRLGTYKICSDVLPGQTISVRKATEAGAAWGNVVKPVMHNKKAELHAVFIEEGVVLVDKVDPAKRRIEFFGDSDTAGFGIEGPDTTKNVKNLLNCTSHLIKYENCDKCYNAQLGRILDAEIYTEAWSGRGMYQNAANIISFAPTMPYYWDHTLATDSH